jgi:hypothetical protein
MDQPNPNECVRTFWMEWEWVAMEDECVCVFLTFDKKGIVQSSD